VLPFSLPVGRRFYRGDRFLCRLTVVETWCEFWADIILASEQMLNTPNTYRIVVVSNG
jgi:hypothetical protein